MNYSIELNENTMDFALKYAGTIGKVAFTYLKNINDAEDIIQEV